MSRGLREERRFQSTLPARGATRHPHSRRYTQHHFNPRSPHGERPRLTILYTRLKHFNPRSPHGERPSFENNIFGLIPFQSTLPARGATVAAVTVALPEHFNPRSPHGERLAFQLQEGDAFDFNPRSPHGERHCCKCQEGEQHFISIHAPRTGSDTDYSIGNSGGWDFNPRSPHGERRQNAPNIVPNVLFQSTLPARGATVGGALPFRVYAFQSTLPARGATTPLQ